MFLADGPAVAGQEGSGGNAHQGVVLWRVIGTLEHVQHPIVDNGIKAQYTHSTICNFRKYKG